MCSHVYVASWRGCAPCGLQNVRHHRQDKSLADFQIPDRERPNLPVSMYPDPEVAPHSLVYRINDDLEYQVDIHEFNGYVPSNWVWRSRRFGSPPSVPGWSLPCLIRVQCC